MTEQWQEWMINGGGVEDGVAKLPARRQVAEWIIGAYKSITKQTARNAWKRWAMNGFWIRNNYNINNYCFVQFSLN